MRSNAPRPCHARLLVAVALALLTAAPAFAGGPKAIGTVSFVGRPGLEAISVVGFQWSVKNGVLPGAGASGGGTSKTTFDPFRIVKFLDATSPALYDLTAGGIQTTEVHLDVTIRRGVTASYVLSEVVINANERHTPASGPPLQELALAATAVRETIVSPGGTVTSCYSTKAIGTCE